MCALSDIEARFLQGTFPLLLSEVYMRDDVRPHFAGLQLLAAAAALVDRVSPHRETSQQLPLLGLGRSSRS